jgi:hypothetical protein
MWFEGKHHMSLHNCENLKTLYGKQLISGLLNHILHQLQWYEHQVARDFGQTGNVPQHFN